MGPNHTSQTQSRRRTARNRCTGRNVGNVCFVSIRSDISCDGHKRPHQFVGLPDTVLDRHDPRRVKFDYDFDEHLQTRRFPCAHANVFVWFRRNNCCWGRNRNCDERKALANVLTCLHWADRRNGVGVVHRSPKDVTNNAIDRSRRTGVLTMDDRSRRPRSSQSFVRQ